MGYEEGIGCEWARDERKVGRQRGEGEEEDMREGVKGRRRRKEGQ